MLPRRRDLPDNSQPNRRRMRPDKADWSSCVVKSRLGLAEPQRPSLTDSAGKPCSTSLDVTLPDTSSQAVLCSVVRRSGQATLASDTRSEARSAPLWPAFRLATLASSLFHYTALFSCFPLLEHRSVMAAGAT